MQNILVTLIFCIVFCTGCFKDNQVKTYTLYRSVGAENAHLYGTEKNVQGFTDDLFFEIAKNEGFKINFVTVPNRQMLSLLGRNRVDGVLTTQIPAHRDEKFYLLSDPYFSFGPVLLLRADDTLEHFKSIKVKVIGFGRNYGEDLTTREDLGYVFRPYEQVITAIEELISSRIDAVVVDSIYGHQLASGLYANKIKVATALFKVTKFRLAVKKGKNDELITLFNTGLEKLRKDGTYDKMLEYWALYEPKMEQ